MANIYEAKGRNVLPAFRSFRDTADLGELAPTAVQPPRPLPFDTSTVVRSWRERPSMAVAGDILSNALVSAQPKMQEALEAAQFILERREQASPALVAVAERVLRGEQSDTGTTALPRLNTFLEDHTARGIWQRIARLRASTRQFTQDPIVFVELARLYSILGLADKAQKNMRLALALAPDNRFVLRSAARLLAHYGEAERAYDVLRRNPKTRFDPWLMSAELALAGLVGRESRHSKEGLALIKSGDFAPLSTTELSSGLATRELLEGSRKRSRDLFRVALDRPNDNSLAQVEWAFSVDRLFDFDVREFDVKRKHEALAREAFGREEWRAVIEHCESWFMDMPFAKRPVMMASHVASVALDDYSVAEMFSRAGLVSHPGNAPLLNNLAYALGLAGRSDEALEVLDSVDSASVDDKSTEVCLIATRGLAHFRKGEIAEGRRLYVSAMEMALSVTNREYRQLALLNYVREELLAGQVVEAEVATAVRRLKCDPKAITLTIFRDKVLSLLDGKGQRSEQ